MLTKTIKVIRPSGLGVNAAGLICDEAAKYTSRVIFRTAKQYEGNMKSVLSILGAGVCAGEEIILIVSGPDEAEAMEAVAELVQRSH